MKKILTKGNIEVQNIKIGDVHYEYEYGFCVKVKVTSLPVDDGTGYWTWSTERFSDGVKVTYGVREDMAHYGPNIYDYEAYRVPEKNQI